MLQSFIAYHQTNHTSISKDKTLSVIMFLKMYRHSLVSLGIMSSVQNYKMWIAVGRIYSRCNHKLISQYLGYSLCMKLG
jgi:hypothetical protein